MSEKSEFVDREISRVVAALLVAKGLPQGALVNVLGIGKGAVSRKMSGTNSWSSEDIVTLSKFFGVSADLLLPPAAEVVSDTVVALLDRFDPDGRGSADERAARVLAALDVGAEPAAEGA